MNDPIQDFFEKSINGRRVFPDWAQDPCTDQEKPSKQRPPTWAELTMKNITPANARFYGLKQCYLRRKPK